KPTEMSNLLSTLKSAALTGHLVEQIKYENNVELVSSDIVGTTAASVVDISATIVSSDGKNIILYVWYDNEYGYTHQVLRLANYLSGIKRFTYYSRLTVRSQRKPISLFAVRRLLGVVEARQDYHLGDSHALSSRAWHAWPIDCHISPPAFS